eukprot:scaffold4073_cov101-Isochrysis_galbana.AAC.2
MCHIHQYAPIKNGKGLGGPVAYDYGPGSGGALTLEQRSSTAGLATLETHQPEPVQLAQCPLHRLADFTPSALPARALLFFHARRPARLRLRLRLQRRNLVGNLAHGGGAVAGLQHSQGEGCGQRQPPVVDEELDRARLPSGIGHGA